jgi:signal transduction histidine kinase
LLNKPSRLSKTGLYITTLTITGSEYRLEPEKEIILFRICQEALNNIVKHSEAKNINIGLYYSANTFNLAISDDGKGFSTKEKLTTALDSNSMGLRNLLNRSKLINAQLSLKSSPGKGTSISVELPVQP